MKSEKSIPTETDVVIIGAGIAGIATAWYLNKAGLRVVVCEKATVACEQSSRNWGWIRQQGRDEAELPIVMESMRLWQEISDELDTDIGYRREGALYLCENEADMAKYDRFFKIAANHDLETNRLNRQQLAALITDCPGRWTSALYTPSDGRAEPALAVPAMAKACASRGVDILQHCAVDEILISNGSVEGVLTEHGPIKSTQVLCAAGAWSTFMLKKCGIQLPQLTVKGSVTRTAPAPNIFNGNASGSNFSFRRRLDGGYNIAMGGYLEFFPSMNHIKNFFEFFQLMKVSLHKLRPRYPELRINGDYKRHRVLDPKPSAKTIQLLRQSIDEKLPALKNVALLESWSGMIDALPDVVPVLDRATATEGLWIATGFSGHGFGIGPAAGRIMADLMQNKAAGHDLNRFRLSRFVDGSPMILGPAI
ncbi:MAG: glycine/D-amino acid oxidase-like deaminating enzyme [Planctomycetota bacterium]|jgi:glycine/D-amino acid oxidase-like deaminating enzyme